MNLTRNIGKVLLLAGFSSLTGIAHADTTYSITTDQSYIGTVSGTITGDGSTISSFLVTTDSGGYSNTFDSTAGDSGSFTDTSFQDHNGVEVYLITLTNTGGYGLLLPVYGDFTSGISYAGHQNRYSSGEFFDTFSTAYSYDYDDEPVTSDNVTLAAVSAVPEPSSLALLGTGLLGCVGTLRKRIRRK